MFTQKIIRFFAWQLKKYGPSLLKKRIWDDEFLKGKWDYIDRTEGDVIYGFLAKYSGNGTILDLGCGSGNTGNEMDFKKYQKYTGVDISEQAVRMAILRTRQNNRMSKNEYFCRDILEYQPDGQYDIILFRESINYFPQLRIKTVLERYQNFLREGGVMIVRIHDREKYDNIVRLIEKEFTICEKYPFVEGKGIILAFR